MKKLVLCADEDADPFAALGQVEKLREIALALQIVEAELADPVEIGRVLGGLQQMRPAPDDQPRLRPASPSWDQTATPSSISR